MKYLFYVVIIVLTIIPFVFLFDEFRGKNWWKAILYIALIIFGTVFIGKFFIAFPMYIMMLPILLFVGVFLKRRGGG